MILASIVFGAGQGISDGVNQGLPHIDIRDLQDAAQAGDLARLEQLKDPGGRLGAFVIDTPYGSTIESFISKAPGCLKSIKESNHLPTLPMEDGSSRTTFAKVSDGDATSGELSCLEPEVSDIDSLFDNIDANVMRIIELFHNGNGGVLQYHLGQKSSNASNLPTKSHIHVYEQGKN